MCPNGSVFISQIVVSIVLLFFSVGVDLLKGQIFSKSFLLASELKHFGVLNSYHRNYIF